MMGMGTWQLVVLFMIIIPIFHVVGSKRSYGGAKFGWFLAVIFFPVLGYIGFLIITQPKRQPE